MSEKFWKKNRYYSRKTFFASMLCMMLVLCIAFPNISIAAESRVVSETGEVEKEYDIADEDSMVFSEKEQGMFSDDEEQNLEQISETPVGEQSEEKKSEEISENVKLAVEITESTGTRYEGQTLYIMTVTNTGMKVLDGIIVRLNGLKAYYVSEFSTEASDDTECIEDGKEEPVAANLDESNGALNVLEMIMPKKTIEIALESVTDEMESVDGKYYISVGGIGEEDFVDVEVPENVIEEMQKFASCGKKETRLSDDLEELYDENSTAMEQMDVNTDTADDEEEYTGADNEVSDELDGEETQDEFRAREKVDDKIEKENVRDDVISVVVPTAFEIPMYRVGNTLDVMSEVVMIQNRGDFAVDVEVSSVQVSIDKTLPHATVQKMLVSTDDDVIHSYKPEDKTCDLTMNVYQSGDVKESYRLKEGESDILTSFLLGPAVTDNESGELSDDRVAITITGKATECSYEMWESNDLKVKIVFDITRHKD